MVIELRRILENNEVVDPCNDFSQPVKLYPARSVGHAGHHTDVVAGEQHRNAELTTPRSSFQ
jgi:hypothetical protein